MSNMSDAEIPASDAEMSDDDDDLLNLLDELQDDDEEETPAPSPSATGASRSSPGANYSQERRLSTGSQSRPGSRQGFQESAQERKMRKQQKRKSELAKLEDQRRRKRREEIQKEKAAKKDICKFSKLRITNRKMSEDSLDTRLRQCEVIRLKDVQSMHKKKLIPSNWAVVAGIHSKITRTSKAGNKFMILKLTDLNHVEIAIFVFNAEAMMKYSGYLDGTVVAVGNAKFMDKSKQNEVALQVSSPNQLLVVGTALDYGKCAAMKRDNTPCTSVVNINYALYCPFHTKQSFEKAASKRGDCNRSKLSKKSFQFGKGTRDMSMGNFSFGGETVRCNDAPKKKKKKKNRGEIFTMDMQAVKQQGGRGAKALMNAHARALAQKAKRNGMKAPHIPPAGMKLVNNPGNSTLKGGMKRKRGTDRLLKKAAPMLGRGWDKPKRSSLKSSQARMREKLGLSGQIKLRTLDPNSTDFDSLKGPNSNRRFGGGGGGSLNHRSRKRPRVEKAPGGGRDRNMWNDRECVPKPKFGAKPKKKKGSFAAAFNKIDVDSAEAKMQLERGSLHKDEAQRAKWEDAMRVVDAIVKDEYVNEGKEQIKSRPVTLWACQHSQCQLNGKWNMNKNPICKKANHPYKAKKSVLSAFGCVKCQKKVYIYGKHYAKSCSKCGGAMVSSSIFRTAGRGPKGEQLQTRSNETELRMR